MMRNSITSPGNERPRALRNALGELRGAEPCNARTAAQPPGSGLATRGAGRSQQSSSTAGWHGAVGYDARVRRAGEETP